ncbi:phosphotriesterase family protein [Caldanaerobacter subterraneus]|uniref:Phosphotriesterase-related protein n=1 Tax=Caldanaerobacter subterraneus TaxID=911092 RepID=A0A4R2JA77_9THEO|nr:phosphotriesterase-related protein [Caldanaerobacter subterraneus]TCO56301.1 phosphotriesterase-related protein [Caldanaerobacter subterraneus]
MILDNSTGFKDIGYTLIHEHLTIDLSRLKEDDDAKLDDVDSLIEDLKELKKSGIDTIVDVTNIGMGRDIERIKYISDISNINVILSTGFYKEPFLPEIVYKSSVKELADIFIDEIINGIDGTNYKASVIGEIGTSKEEIREVERKIFEAAAIAHNETGVPIITHTTLGFLGLEQIKIFKNMKVNLEKVVIGHVDLNIDMDYYLTLLDNGCYLAFDTIGKTNYQPDELRAISIKKLIDKGFINKILLSLDISRKSYLKNYGGFGHSYIVEKFIPLLKNVGVTEADIKTMLYKNPLELFGG